MTGGEWKIQDAECEKSEKCEKLKEGVEEDVKAVLLSSDAGVQAVWSKGVVFESHRQWVWEF